MKGMATHSSILAGYSPGDHKELGTTQRLTLVPLGKFLPQGCPGLRARWAPRTPPGGLPEGPGS